MTAQRIDSPRNPKVKAWRALHARKERRAAGLYWIEGVHLVQEALAHAPGELVALIARDGAPYLEIPTACPAKRYTVSPAVMAALSDTEQPQGWAAIARLPDLEAYTPRPGRYLALDNVRDPGNVGTLLRTADAAGLDGVLACPTTADLYGPKTVRAGQGAHFHLPLAQGALIDWLAALRATGTIVLCADAKRGRSYRGYIAPESFVLIAGNEAEGVTPALAALADETLTIPLPGKAESLSVAVAVGILLFALAEK